MSVWRKQTVRFVVDGKQVRKGTPGAKRRREESKRFYGTVTLANGKRKQTPLTDERDTSETLLRRLQTAEDTKRVNGADRFHDDRQRPLGEFLAEYAAFRKSRDNSAFHDGIVLSRCRAIIAATRASTIADLSVSQILNVLSEWRLRKKKPMSIGTCNNYLRAMKAFSRWLWRERKTADDPLIGLRILNNTNPKRIRRPLSDSETETLLATTAECTKTYRGSDWQFTSTDRSMLYAIAAFTGLRANEIASLTKSSFDFDSMTWTLAAAKAKNRKLTTLPISPALVNRLRPWFATLKRDELFPGSWVGPGKCFAGKFIKRDLKRAGIEYRDAAGRVADFHSLRHTFITSLAKRGVHPAKAQRLARHSTIALTMNVYTSLAVDDLRDAVAGIGQ